MKHKPLTMCEMRDVYAGMGTEIASYWTMFGQWSVNSQYGYIVEWADSKDEAEAAAFAYYQTRTNLLRQ